MHFLNKLDGTVDKDEHSLNVELNDVAFDVISKSPSGMNDNLEHSRKACVKLTINGQPLNNPDGRLLIPDLTNAFSNVVALEQFSKIPTGSDCSLVQL